MKTLKPINALLILFFCLMFVTAHAAESYKKTFEKVEYISVGGKQIGKIRLSDGSVWKWTPEIYVENYLRNWMPGDEILIRNINHAGFALYNFSQPRYEPIVSLSSESFAKLLKISVISEDNLFLKLSDGSEWQLSLDFQRPIVHEWQVGDIVIPTKAVPNGYLLINVDVPYESHGYNRRQVNVYPASELAPVIQHKSLESAG